MTLLGSRFLSTLRKVSQFPRKTCFQRNAIQRNYWRSRDSFSELPTARRSFENYMKEMDKEINRMLDDVQRLSPVKFPRILPPFDFIKGREIPVISNEDGRSYKLDLDMQGMKPENINITLKNNELTITARQDEKRDDGSRFLRENTYHYILPDGINPDTVRSSLTGGVLSIEALLPSLESKEIPVNIQSGEKSSSDSDSEKSK